MNPVKRALRNMQDRREERFAEQRKLIACGDSGLLELEIGVHHGVPVTLRSGAVITPGTPVAELHLNSRKLADYFRNDPPMRARMRMFRDADASFKAVAKWLQEDRVGRTIDALCSVTLLDREMKHFGFEILPLPLWPWVFVGIHMEWLAYLYRDERVSERQKERVPLLKRVTPRHAWLSRRDFLDKYGQV